VPPEAAQGRRQEVSKTILVVDDSPTTRSLIASNLSETGDYDVIEAASGFEALKVLPSRKVDLIIPDINMPDINGLELISFVRENPIYSAIPTMIVTTEDSEEDRRRGMQLGAREYVIKPFTVEELQEAVHRAMTQGKD
jgi:two-component system chemotaxis response regulator CheY